MTKWQHAYVLPSGWNSYVYWKKLLTLRERLSRPLENIMNYMPGYTHHTACTTYHSFSTIFLAHANAFMRDTERIRSAYRHTNLNPLGAAAFASTGFAINRKGQLNFSVLIRIWKFHGCSQYTWFYDREHKLFSNMMTNLSRMAEELILWSSSEFGFIELDDSIHQHPPSCRKRRIPT